MPTSSEKDLQLPAPLFIGMAILSSPWESGPQACPHLPCTSLLSLLKGGAKRSKELWPLPTS